MKAYWLIPLAALATGQVAARAPSERDAAGEKPRLVCFTEPSTGSHIRKRTCVTEAEAEARKKRDQEAMDSLHRAPAAPQAAPASLR